MLAAREKLFQKNAKQVNYSIGQTDHVHMLLICHESHCSKISFIPFIEQRREKMHMPYAPAIMQCDNHGPHVADEIQTKLAASNIRLLTVPPHSTHVTQKLDLVTISAVKGDLPPRKGALMPKYMIEKIKLMYLVLEKRNTSSTNESALREAGYSFDGEYLEKFNL
ncbi:MAG: hypothetical protein EZS28_014864 [Streblomastix strix]|uniref:DDE-1 domain-containing protein n=1 Tax=Streblomastix strix TaxID=222440 RepID=A0A5J4W597_9EUKA|nr:MAG: hypothetical protein EZS28_014864 [Streblomastix strix]